MDSVNRVRIQNAFKDMKMDSVNRVRIQNASKENGSVFPAYMTRHSSSALQQVQSMCFYMDCVQCGQTLAWVK
jgi:hypothetical protein